MFNYNKRNDLPGFDIFERLFELALNRNLEKNKIVQTNSNPININHLSLLFAWPGILLMQLAKITKDKENIQNLQKLKELLDCQIGYAQARDILDNICGSEKLQSKFAKKFEESEKSGNISEQKQLLKEFSNFIPKLFKSSVLLLHSKSLLSRFRPSMYRLSITLYNYYIICCMISKFYNRPEENAFITKKDIDRVYEACGIDDSLNIYLFSKLWLDNLKETFNAQFSNIRSLISAENESILNESNMVDFKSIKIILKCFNLDRLWKYALVKKYDKLDDITVTVGNSWGWGININLNSYFEYSLWHIRAKEDVFNQENLTNAFLFFDIDRKRNDTLTNLIIRLYQLGKQSSIAMQGMIESWEDFIDDPSKSVEFSIENYDDWVFTLLKDYIIRDELLKFKDLSRIIGDLDTELEYEIIKEVRDEYKYAKKYHIPIELRKKLLEAKDELDLFIALILKNHLIFEEDDILKFYDENRSKFNYICLLTHDDIRNIIFSTEANASRNNRRKILSIINDKLGGKNFKESTLTKLLGLEPGKEKYLTYSTCWQDSEE